MKTSPPPDAFLSRIRLRHLHCFVAVAQAQHLGRAGERLGLTQPAVSKTLTELEELVGTRLLVRQRAGTDLTAAGMRFLRHALRILEDLDAAAQSLSGDALRHERIRVGALPSIVPALLIDAVTRFRSSHADVALAVQTGMNRTLIDLLKADVLDVVIGRLDDPAAMEGLWFESLAGEPLVLAVRAGHPLVTHARPTMHDVQAFPMVVPAMGSIPRHSTESLLARHGLTLPEGCLETADAYLSQLVTLRSDSVWAAPLSATRLVVATGDMALLPIATPGTEEPIGLLRRSDRTLEPVAEAFVDTIRTIAARQPD